MKNEASDTRKCKIKAYGNGTQFWIIPTGLDQSYLAKASDQNLDLWLKSYSNLTYYWFQDLGVILESKIPVIDQMYQNSLKFVKKKSCHKFLT